MEAREEIEDALVYLACAWLKKEGADRRLLGGLLYAARPRVGWATLLRRSFSVDVLECPRCHRRLRMIAVVTEREAARRILAPLGLPTDPPPVARARDPTDEDVDDDVSAQLPLGLA